MNRTSVVSSNLKSVGYDVYMAVLEIEFLSGGIYQYFNVPDFVYHELINATSKGKFFAHNIKNNKRYPCRKVFPESKWIRR